MRAKTTQTRSARTAKRLQALIAESIIKNPYELSGQKWCRLSHIERASALGVNECTVRRIIGREPGTAPYVVTTRLINNVRTTLVRIGEPTDEDRQRGTAKILAAIWRKFLAANVAPKRDALLTEIDLLKKAGDSEETRKAQKALQRLHINRETWDEFGCFNGLAKDWPDGLQADLFKMVLHDYAAFMAGVKFDLAISPPTTTKTYSKALEAIYQRFPHIPTIRRFWMVAVEMMVTHYQESGKVPPQPLQALNPSLWAHLTIKAPKMHVSSISHDF